jgi:hypothetical protein
MGSKPYVVRGGDYLTSIAHRNGTTVDAILALSENAKLKKQRANPEILAVGDVVYIPDPKLKWLGVQVGSSNSFKGTIPKVTVSVVLKGPDGKPLAGKTVTTHPVLSENPIKTDGKGLLSVEVGVLVRTVEVEVEDSGLRFHLRVGNLDPHDEDSGALSRLRQLGYVGNEGPHVAGRPWLAAHEETANRLALARGVAAFQTKNGKEATGELDDDAASAIRDEHGC